MTYSLVPEHDRVQYANNIQHLLQDRGGKLAGTVMTGTHQGKQMSVVDQYGTVDMKEKGGQRYAPIEFSDLPHDRRWVVPTAYDLAIPVDDFDKLRTISDPTNAYVEAGRKAIARKDDHLIMNAFFASAKTGEMGETAETFDTSTYRVGANVGGNAATGLNVAKIKRAVKLFLNAEVDFDDPDNQRYMAISAEENEQLLDELQVINGDYRGRYELDGDGRITSFLGFRFVHFSEATFTKFGLESGNDRLLPCWVKSGVHFGRFDPAGHGPMNVDIAPRKDLKGHPTQIYFDMQAGATRLEQGKVLQILSRKGA